MTRNNALIILTSVKHMGADEKQTGFYWEELATPYWRLVDAGYDVTIASVAGGQPPADPSSGEADNRPESVQRFMDDPAAMSALAHSKAVSDVRAEDFAVVFLPGGHGTMWDLAQTESVGQAVTTAYEAGAVVGAVCHGPAGLVNARLSDGTPLVAGKRVNSFTNAEEEAVGLAGTVPFPLETRLLERGARFEGNPENFQPYAVRDGRLVTGQNPRSSERVATLMLQALADQRD